MNSSRDEKDPALVWLSSVPSSETFRNMASDGSWFNLLPVSSHLHLLLTSMFLLTPKL